LVAKYGKFLRKTEFSKTISDIPSHRCNPVFLKLQQFFASFFKPGYAAHGSHQQEIEAEQYLRAFLKSFDGILYS